MRARFVFGLLAIVGVPAGAHAADVTAGGSIEGRLGYGSNPFLNLDTSGGTGTVSGTLTGWLDRRTEASRTRLTAIAGVDQYFQNYGKAQNYFVGLSHDETFSPRLSGTAKASYQDSINARTFGDVGGVNTDLLSIGQRSHQIAAQGSLNWQATSRDTFYVAPSFSRITYPGLIASDFTDYGVNGGYLRQINERLQVGIDLGYQRLHSQRYPASNSYSSNLRLIYDFNQIWHFEGSVGLIHQVTPGLNSSSTIGFSARLCGKYPRDQVCADVARQSAPSGFGGLRTDNRFTLSYIHDFSSRSHFHAGGTYDISDSAGGITILPKQKYWELSAGYTREVSRRVNAGFSARYQHRDFGHIPGLADTNVSGYSATLDVAYKFGHIDS